jgi:hypothetical protein
MSDRGKPRSRFKAIIESLRRLLRRKPTPPPADPYAYTMAPIPRGPKGRSGAAVAEPEDDSHRAFPPRRS